jgi:FAD/FMN-containing dehydrogenase
MMTGISVYFNGTKTVGPSRGTCTRRYLLCRVPTQSAIFCGRVNGVRLRVCNDGHDYEGLSYRSLEPWEVFGVVNLSSLRAITVTVDELLPTAWVDSGAMVGELYYAVAKNNPGLAFPAGVCPTTDVGGHFSGGGIGMIMRKYGLSTDNVVDAKLVDVKGDLLDRAIMGEDLFWAIRGGGGGSFGIVVSWKVSLVKVPPTVTVAPSTSSPSGRVPRRTCPPTSPCGSLYRVNRPCSSP